MPLSDSRVKNSKKLDEYTFKHNRGRLTGSCNICTKLCVKPSQDGTGTTYITYELNVAFTSLEMAIDHISGSKHQKTLKCWLSDAENQKRGIKMIGAKQLINRKLKKERNVGLEDEDTRVIDPYITLSRLGKCLTRSFNSIIVLGGLIMPNKGASM